MKTSKFWAVDHTGWCRVLLYNEHYTLLEDGSVNYFYHEWLNNNPEKLNFKQKIKSLIKKIIYGNYNIKPYGHNKNCEKIILTGFTNLPDYYSNLNYEILPLNELWNNSGDDKKSFILEFFDVTQNDLNKLEGRNIIFLDQQWAIDKFMTEAEQIEMTRKILKDYDPSKVVIKLHPRNPLNYSEALPGFLVWDKPAPMELLNLCGVNLKTAITLNSTAVILFSNDVEIIWLGKDKNLTGNYFDHLNSETKERLMKINNLVPLPKTLLKSN